MMHIRFATVNDEFKPTREDAITASIRALETVSAQLQRGYVSGSVQDTNGNTIGAWKLTGVGL